MNGSRGRLTSRDVGSAGKLALLEVVRDAKVLVRPLNNAEPFEEFDGPIEDVIKGWSGGEIAEGLSEPYDCDPKVVRIARVFASFDITGYAWFVLEAMDGSSTGISSGAGNESPLATATS